MVVFLIVVIVGAKVAVVPLKVTGSASAAARNTVPWIPLYRKEVALLLLISICMYILPD